MVEEVLTRDVSSGKVHKRYRTESGELATLEGDNLDQAGAYEVISAEQLADSAAELCERCFPPTPDPEAEA